MSILKQFKKYLKHNNKKTNAKFVKPDKQLLKNGSIQK